MGAHISDEFAGMPLSRQMKYYLRKRRDKRCTRCGKPLEEGSLCPEHMVQMREYRRKTFGLKRRYHNSLSYQFQGDVANEAPVAMGTPTRNIPEPKVREPNLDLELSVPADHPLRSIKRRVDSLLSKHAHALNGAQPEDRPGAIPPAVVLKSWVLMNLYSIRSTALFCEQLSFNVLWLWFLDRTLKDGGFDPAAFAQTYERVLATGEARLFFSEVMAAKAA
jgi:transposase